MLMEPANRSAIMYPVVAKSALVMSLDGLGRVAAPSISPTNTTDRPLVRAATVLTRDSSTEIIDVNTLCQKTTSIIQYVEVADSDGRLYCVDGLVGTSCWLKIVSLAKDCHSYNVVLMSTDKGVVLKTIKSITPGEPLLMWFSETVLAMLNMPFLTPSNIQGQNRYICHHCNNLFEYPNPLKIHLALKCNKLDSNHLWKILAGGFRPKPQQPLTLSLFPPELPTFKFELSSSPTTSPTRTSPASLKLEPITSDSPSSSGSNQTSPNNSMTQHSPTTLVSQILPPSALEVHIPSIRKGLEHHHSAFKPYNMNNKSTSLPYSRPLSVTTAPRRSSEDAPINAYRVQTQPLRNDNHHAAQMETLVSNLGKSKQGHLCIYCGKVYSRKYGLKIHIRTHTGYKPLKCKFCLRPFGDPSNLNKHVRLHGDGETPYRCDLCGKVLVRRRDLERHIRSRHQENADSHISDVSSDGTDA